MAKNNGVPAFLLFTALCVCRLFIGGVIAQPAVDPASGEEARACKRFSRHRLRQVYTAELGVTEATGRNDGQHVETYLRYTGLGKGHDWCSAWISWCFGQAGQSQPRNPWCPALFPRSRIIWSYNKEGVVVPRPGDVFGLWNSHLGRVAHVGFVDQWTGTYLISMEGNSNNAVERRRRTVSSIYQVADWVR